MAEHLVGLLDSSKSDFDSQLAAYIDAASEEPHAIAILCKSAATLMKRVNQLPTPLQEFVVEFLCNPSVGAKRGPDKHGLTMRNILIGFAIQNIAKTWRIAPTRNAATKDGDKRGSAASIVQAALNNGARIKLGEDDVNKIWGDSPWAWARAFRRLAPEGIRSDRFRVAFTEDPDKVLALYHRLKKLNFSVSVRRKN